MSMDPHQHGLNLGSHTPVGLRENPYYAALEELWKLKDLPLQVRLFVIGMVQRAAIRQGDSEVIPADIIAQISDPAAEPLHPDDTLRMIDAVDRYAFDGKRRLRPQYAQIILSRTVTKLNTEYQPMATDFHRKIKAIAESN